MYDFLGKKICIVFSDEATTESVFISHKEVRIHFVGAHCYYAVHGILLGFYKLYTVLCELKLQVIFLCFTSTSLT